MLLLVPFCEGGVEGAELKEEGCADIWVARVGGSVPFATVREECRAC